MKTLQTALLSCLMLVTSSPALAAPMLSQPNTIELFAGRSRLFNTPSKLERVAISDPKVADVRIISGQQIMVQGLKPGLATVFVWTKASGTLTYEIKVALDAAAVQDQVRSLTSNPDLHVAFTGNAFLLSGPARTAMQRDQAEKIVASYGSPVINLIPMPQRREQIAIDVSVVELSKTGGLNLGISPGGGATSAISNGVRQYVFKPGEMDLGLSNPSDIKSFGPIDYLTVQLEALQRRGEAKLLARPTLVTVDGGTARFLAGGEIPIPIQQSLGTTSIMWKEFGVRLEVQPHIAADDRIQLTVKPEVSSLDYANGIKQAAFNIPSIKTRRAETEVMLAPDETLMLGGLLSNEQSKGLELLPGIGDIPIIGELFRSRRFQDAQTELAILVTPRLVAPKADTPPPGRLPDIQRELSEAPASAAALVPADGQAAAPGAR